MKVSLWWLLIAIGICLQTINIRGESNFIRFDLREERRRGSTAISSRRTISEESLCSGCSETDITNACKCDRRIVEHASLDDTMTKTPYLTLALKVLLMAILCYTL
uniref:Uncharacterized protein n=1 Tax=Anopheles minimus TaxID=112268 RepID=A0A182WEN6_9DIPT